MNVPSYNVIKKNKFRVRFGIESNSKDVALLHNICDPCVDSVTSADLFNNIITTFYFCELCRARMECVQICFPSLWTTRFLICFYQLQQN